MRITDSVKESEKVFIFDYSSLAYQAYYGSPGNPKGRFFDLVIGSIEQFLNPGDVYSIVFAIDSTPIRKLKIYREYKANRRKDGSDPKGELMPCLDLVKCVHASSYGEEADDVIATLCTILKGKEKIIITTDSDLSVLLDSRTNIYSPRTGEVLSQTSHIKEEGFSAKMASIVKVFSGDSSDNIKPVKPKFGQKKTLSMIKDFVSEGLGEITADLLFQYIRDLGEFTDDHKSSFEMNKELILLRNDVTLNIQKRDPSGRLEDFVSEKPESYLKYKLLGLTS